MSLPPITSAITMSLLSRRRSKPIKKSYAFSTNKNALSKEVLNTLKTSISILQKISAIDLKQWNSLFNWLLFGYTNYSPKLSLHYSLQETSKLQE